MKIKMLCEFFNFHHSATRKYGAVLYSITLLCGSSTCFAQQDSHETKYPGKDKPASANSASALQHENPNYEIEPIAFKSSYLGLLINQNYTPTENPYLFGAPKTSWGAEYRFFYKDQWTLSVMGAFKGQQDANHQQRSNFSISQETMRIIRIYHPWYLTAGGRLSYIIPVRKISIPYERDQDRSMDTGGALSVGAIFIVNERLLAMVSGHRWTSFSSTKNQGLESVIGLLLPFR